MKELYVTCYCPESCPGEITADGSHVRKGIAAMNKEHLGKTCILYTTDMSTCLGIFEIRDTGGTDGLKAGRVIDLWQPTLAECKEIMALTGGKVLIQFIEGEG